ncbi:dihydroxyacetone kinase subunit DhaK [Shouchella patagoniensis]|uniref:dihydroxyacetone kinase subunit DhaK n=1 Tax=Shouchella patagoniensis TaxID=228576 RepID=UPI0009959C75|nr:dihydroxyacetone kinase subunit DhaK [Shouchella patagoniensis]
MKKLMNDPNHMVNQFLEGLIAAHPNLIERVEGANIIVRKNMTKNKVGLVSGGGSGHEPAHAGYVGEGMLDAAVAGEVFTSPGADQFLTAIQAANQGKGVVLLIKNYNGDVMNAEMAQEMADAEGIAVEIVIINDDVSVANPDQRRGIAGTVLVHKIAGAAAEAGSSLTNVKAIAEKAVKRIRSMSVALSSCTLPVAGKTSFQLNENEMEVGIGIHGEQGMHRRDVMTSAETADLLLGHLLKEVDGKAPLLVLVNGMGSTPLLEQYVFAGDVKRLLDEQGRTMRTMLVGDYMTSLDMAGISLTLLALDEELEGYIASKATTIQWMEGGSNE